MWDTRILEIENDIGIDENSNINIDEYKDRYMAKTEEMFRELISEYEDNVTLTKTLDSGPPEDITMENISMNARNGMICKMVILLDSFIVTQAKVQILYNDCIINDLKFENIDDNKNGINGTFDETIISYPTELMNIIDNNFFNTVNAKYIMNIFSKISSSQRGTGKIQL